MIARRCFLAPTVRATVLVVVLTLLLSSEFNGSAAERWSRQVSNSEWIPLANPRAASAVSHLSQSNTASDGGHLAGGTHLPNPIESLALPPALQQQYQEQLIQLQKTQEHIQKLLLLQQQLRAQQQLLQSQTLTPSGFSNAENEKQASPSSLGNLRTPPELLEPEALIPPQPSSDALPPVYPPQNFLHTHRPGQNIHQHQNAHVNQELTNLPIHGQIVLQQHGQNGEIAENVYVTKQQQGGHRPDEKRPKSHPHAPPIEAEEEEEEEVQLVYVPAETLAQRGQSKRGRGRKQYPGRQQHRENQENIEQTSLSTPEQEAFTRQVLQQIQKEHEEKAHFLKEERMKEFVRLNEEQKALERKARLQQEALQREQELLRQKEAEKKRKELERIEEMAKQRELERIRETREKQRLEELERRRLAELRAKEEKRREEEAARQLEDRRQKIEQQRLLESQQQQQEDRLRAGSGPGLLHQNSQSQTLLREQARRPAHLADGNRTKKIRGRPRQRVSQYQEQSNFREPTTTPSPNQPPLSVYMGGSASRLDSVKVTDVLRILRDAKTIAVLDNVGPNAPQVFVGPSNLDPPYGYAKFDLPYLSSIDHNRVERKVDKLPFFVAPLSFDPPPGYSKIPFPAPHIGSVVVNTLSDSTPEPDTPAQNPNPAPLIEPNSYSDADQSGSIAASTASYDSPSTSSPNFAPAESGKSKYHEPAYSAPSSGSRFRFRQYYDNKPTSVISTSYYGEHSANKPKQHEQEKLIHQSPKHDTTVSYRQEVSHSGSSSFQEKTHESSQDPSTKTQDLAAQLALINQELSQQREGQNGEQYQSQVHLRESYDANDVRMPLGSRYNLPAELPPISPQLPGLVNSLVDKQEANDHPGSSTPTTTTAAPTTTTTARVSSTTYRPRGRNRVVPTRPRTTQASGKTSEKTRPTRPTYNRSKSRFTTTTEDYRETYEPTKSKTSETVTQKYNTVETQKRPTPRTQKYRNRDKASSQSANQNVQTFENYPIQSDSQSNAGSPPDVSPTSEPAAASNQKETGVSDYTRENYPPTAPTQTENYPLLREVTVQHGTPLISDDYAGSQNYPSQNRPQEAHYQQQQQSGAATYEQNGSFQETGLEKTPVNGFNYQVASSPMDPQREGAKDYSRYQEKLEDAYNLASTEDPRLRADEEHRYSPIYEVNVAQTQPNYNAGGENLFRNDGKLENEGAIDADPNATPIFVPLQQSKQEEYELQIPSTEQPLIEIATTSTTTQAPVIIRQRVRGRLGGSSRPHHDSAIQTRPRGSQDEYVRFSAVNHDRVTHRNRDKTRTRARPSQGGSSQADNNNNEYIKLHAAQQQKLVATTLSPQTTTTTTTTTSVPEEDVDYGFIRPPSFSPVHPVQPIHPADQRFQAPITYRPNLSEIQHIIPNDETAVESSPTHILKNRPKYQQIPIRRPTTTKVFATTTTSTTTTEAVPVATTIPDDATVYATKTTVRTDEQKRLRGRTRRPAKKRVTTTTTESGLDANNELPLDENYPRLTSQQLAVTGQPPLYDDSNFEVAPQVAPNQNRQSQFYEENGENYPQEFLLNFGNPEQVSQQDEYDQTQLASVSSKKYSQSTRGDSTGDIYGAESQWSTKLSKTSFQPSFATNRIADESKRNRVRNNNAHENAPEIITAGPEVPSVTMVVSSDYQKRVYTGDVSAMMDTTDFGRKTNARDHTEKLNGTTSSSSTTMLRDRVQSDKESLEMQDWMSYKNENSAEPTDDFAKVTRKIADPLIRKTRRRRVRVRVRPAPTDDFVTAESQHFNSAVNSLVQNEYKYNPIRESKPITTAEPIATSVTATTVTEAIRKSLLQDFLEEMLKNDEVSIPTRVTVGTTELPDWTMTTPMTTPYAEITTLIENHTSIGTTLAPNVVAERVTTTDSPDLKEDSREATSFESSDVRKETKSEDYWDKNSQENKSEQNNLENVEFSENYNLPSHYPDGSGTSKEIEDTIAEMTAFPVVNQEIRKLSVVQKEKEHIMTLRKKQEEVNVEENEAHPKNHRTKWSEVRYPSVFDKTASKLHSTTSVPGVVTQNEKEDSGVKTLSDYVKAIFDTMKSAEKEEEEEVAKVVETKNENPTANNDVAPIRRTDAEKEFEGIDRWRTDATEHMRDAYATERVEEKTTSAFEEEDPSVTEEATTKESVTRFETTTAQIPDTTTIAPLEETTQEFPTTTTTTTSIKQTTDVKTNSTETTLGKILRTSTTTKVSHMTEICYRGRCVMTRPRDVMRR
ncbi:uncharacterized protein LOC109858538 [Pseudomyrmex gracilis]|uniref:uncharacterized protein LOC109858538 n=1 Tax=Pseudomyrmex gracilis TaxID=219809 RepID=UPI000994DC3A|nr:uncharacterized protein LOC109858538 [Pseudomyrmex gracilis]